MKNFISLHGRTIALASVLVLLAGLLGYVALRAGPMAPVAVTVNSVDSQDRSHLRRTDQACGGSIR